MSDAKKAIKSVVAPFFDPFGLIDDAKDALTPEIPDPGAPPNPVDAEKAGIEAAASKSEKRRRLLAQQGRQSTFATSPAGLVGEANVQRKTLFGQ